jgi:uncharacterized membrane protein YgcG
MRARASGSCVRARQGHACARVRVMRARQGHACARIMVIRVRASLSCVRSRQDAIVSCFCTCDVITHVSRVCMTPLLPVATQFAILSMAKLDAGSSYGEYGGGGSDGSFGGASSSAGEGGYGGGQSLQQPFSLATCASVLRFCGSVLPRSAQAKR